MNAFPAMREHLQQKSSSGEMHVNSNCGKSLDQIFCIFSWKSQVFMCENGSCCRKEQQHNRWNKHRPWSSCSCRHRPRELRSGRRIQHMNAFKELHAYFKLVWILWKRHFPKIHTLTSQGEGRQVAWNMSRTCESFSESDKLQYYA